MKLSSMRVEAIFNEGKSTSQLVEIEQARRTLVRLAPDLLEYKNAQELPDESHEITLRVGNYTLSGQEVTLIDWFADRNLAVLAVFIGGEPDQVASAFFNEREDWFADASAILLVEITDKTTVIGQLFHRPFNDGQILNSGYRDDYTEAIQAVLEAA